MLGKQVLDGNFRLLDAGGIVLTLHRKTDLIQLETVQDVTVGNRTGSDVGNFPNCRLLLDLDDDAPALRGLFTRELDVFEVAGVPQRVEIALHGGRVVNIARFGKNTSPDGLRRDAPVTGDVDLGDNVVLRPGQATRR